LYILDIVGPVRSTLHRDEVEAGTCAISFLQGHDLSAIEERADHPWSTQFIDSSSEISDHERTYRVQFLSKVVIWAENVHIVGQADGELVTIRVLYPHPPVVEISRNCRLTDV